MDRVWVEKLCAASGIAPAPTVGRFEALLRDLVPNDGGNFTRMKLILEARWVADRLAPRAHRAGPVSGDLENWTRGDMRNWTPSD